MKHNKGERSFLSFLDWSNLCEKLATNLKKYLILN